MSIETMTKLATTTLSANTASVTFSNIPQNYTDLTVIVSSRDDRSGQPNDDIALRVGFGGTINTGSIYSNIRIFGNGASAGSGSAGGTFMYVAHQTGATATASTFGSSQIYIPNYTSSNFKSVSAEGVSENNSATAWAVVTAGLISDTRPISDISLFPADASNFVTHSTFTLYGVKAARTAVGNSIKATGGNISFDGTYVSHTFNTSGTFTPSDSLRVDYLVVAGGGGGGSGGAGAYNGGGGGAGGYRYLATQSLTAGTSYTATIGAGGASNTTGSNSVFSSTTSSGGGRGAGTNAAAAGGSGGGGSTTSTSGAAGNAGSYSPSEGNSGGGGQGGGPGFGGGGGGGASAVGGNASTAGIGTGGTGGAGTANSITGTSVIYAGGGGGGAAADIPSTPGAGGAGGGGAGSVTGAGVAGTANTGGGGGGGFNGGSSAGGSGGSGVVIIRYRAIA